MSGNGTRRRRFPVILSAAALMAGLLVEAGPARAQFVFDGGILPPRAVAWRLADRGFTPLGRPRFDGRGYVVDAVSPGGARVRLFVDPEDGAIVGRQRLDPPMVAYNRPSAPGYGWTEEDGRPPVPPAPIPGAARPRPDPRVPAEAYGPPGGGIDGLNPERAARPEAPRRSARLTVPEKARPAARTAPEAPRPRLPETAQPAPAGKPDAPAEAATPPAPAASPAPAPAPAGSAQTEARDAPTWRDPPADGSRRVRVIGGATMVPGTADRATDKASDAEAGPGR